MKKPLMAFVLLLVFGTCGAQAASPERIESDLAHAARVEGAGKATGQVALQERGGLITSATDVQIAIPAGKVTSVQSASIVQNENSSIAFQQVADSSLRVAVHIDNVDAPERYPFRLLGVHRLIRLPDGAVMALDKSGKSIAYIEAPWARGKDGPVPTHYEIKGDTITQVVEHQSGGYSYPIVADPDVRTHFWGISVHFSGGETDVIGAAGIAGAANRIMNMKAIPRQHRWWIAAAGAALAVLARQARQHGHCLAIKHINIVCPPLTIPWIEGC